MEKLLRNNFVTSKIRCKMLNHVQIAIVGSKKELKETLVLYNLKTGILSLNAVNVTLVMLSDVLVVHFVEYLHLKRVIKLNLYPMALINSKMSNKTQSKLKKKMVAEKSCSILTIWIWISDVS